MEFLNGYMKENSGMKRVKPLSANSTKWSNTLKQFVENSKQFWINVIEKQYAEAAIQRCSQEKVFWKYVANLQENTHAKVQFQYSCKATLLKSHFDMGVLL